ncbi:MAG: hypothetical protein ACLFMO_03440 [Eubacteriales bacterium]
MDKNVRQGKKDEHSLYQLAKSFVNAIQEIEKKESNRKIRRNAY